MLDFDEGRRLQVSGEKGGSEIASKIIAFWVVEMSPSLLQLDEHL